MLVSEIRIFFSAKLSRQIVSFCYRFSSTLSRHCAADMACISCDSGLPDLSVYDLSDSGVTNLSVTLECIKKWGWLGRWQYVRLFWPLFGTIFNFTAHAPQVFTYLIACCSSGFQVILAWYLSSAIALSRVHVCWWFFQISHNYLECDLPNDTTGIEKSCSASDESVWSYSTQTNADLLNVSLCFHLNKLWTSFPIDHINFQSLLQFGTTSSYLFWT